MWNFKETVFNNEINSFFVNVTPTKLTEGRRLKLGTKGWGLLTDYYLESVKITRLKTGEVHSTAIVKMGDRSGQIVCVVRGPIIGLLFGVSKLEWTEIENLCERNSQLFYRYFKYGLHENFTFEQKLFYNFCLNNQKANVLAAIFSRSVNKRNKERGDAFLDISDLRKCDNNLLDLYIKHLRHS